MIRLIEQAVVYTSIICVYLFENATRLETDNIILCRFMKLLAKNALCKSFLLENCVMCGMVVMSDKGHVYIAI